MKRKKPSKTSGSPSFANPEIGQIEQLLRFMSEHNLEEFEYSRGDLQIRLRKPSAHVVMAAQPGRRRKSLCRRRWPPSAQDAAAAACGSGFARWRRSAPGEVADCGHLLLSPSPGAEEFVKVGMHVDIRADTVHCGSHEADERNRIGSERGSAPHLRGKRAAGGIRAAAVWDSTQPEKIAGSPDYVPENSSSQSRGNRPASHLRLQRTGHCDGGRVFGGRPQFAARAVCGRSGVHRPATQQRKLSEHSPCDQRGGNHQRRCHSSGLRISVGKCKFCEGLRSLGDYLHWPKARSDRDDGRKGPRAARDEGRGVADHSGQRRRGGRAKSNLPRKPSASATR